jgi:hypothetical protein
MSDVKLERKESFSRDEAAEWLSLLSRAFTQGGHVEFPFGGGTEDGAAARTRARPRTTERKPSRSAKPKRG